MTPSRTLFAALLAVVAILPAAPADTLRHAGVLGNSGGQGDTLVRMGAQPASGIGVVQDSEGFLWDRGGAGVLNRYAVDGRLISTHRMAPTTDRRDGIVSLGDTLLLKLGSKLYSLPVSAAPDEEPAILPVGADRLSLGTHDGWAAASRGNQVFWVNAAGETRDIVTLADPVEDIEVGPDGSVYAKTKAGFARVDPGAPEDARGPFKQPGERPQWLDGHWYGHSWHGTIRRFSRELEPAPGVVLGGASGSFIGYVEGNHELDNGRGLAHLRGNLFAVSGIAGILHLMEWRAVDQRFVIIRRIGSVRASPALALDGKGRVWHDGGVWDWTDGPAAPVHHSVPGPSPVFGASVMSNGVMVAPAFRWGKPALYIGALDGPAGITGGVDELGKNLVASTVLESAKRRQLVVVDEAGNGFAYTIGANGKPSGKAVPVALAGSRPIAGLTSLAALDGDTLVAATSAGLITFAGDGDGWSESAETRFEGKIHVAASDGRIWISDTTRHRVLCLDATTGERLAGFGTVDRPGNGPAALNAPTTIAANGGRAVVFDSLNQRLVRLELVHDAD